MVASTRTSTGTSPPNDRSGRGGRTAAPSPATLQSFPVIRGSDRIQRVVELTDLDGRAALLHTEAACARQLFQCVALAAGRSR